MKKLFVLAMTVALNFLEKQGLVRPQRGEETAKDAYGAPEAELHRLFD